MEFRIADTFTGSLAKLTGEEQKSVKTTAFDLQMNPAHPGMQLHKLERAKDKNFWSVRVGRDLRLIVHKSGSNLLLCYVDHHDAEYHWAERRRLEQHPRTGAAQIVEIREMVREIEVPRYIEIESPAAVVANDARKIFIDVTDDELLGYGVPVEWLADVKAATEDSLLDLSDQRIFQTPLSWCALGVDVRGRSQTLRINYRTSHQIRRQADRLLPNEIADVDGVTERRGGTISAFNGPEPLLRTLASPEEESACIADWLKERRDEGYHPQEIGVFVRSEAELDRAIKGIEDAGFSAMALSTRPGGAMGSVAVGTMHFAKGLEFRAVVVAGCDDEVLPLQSRIESVVDEADLEEVYNSERHLLYVACTRARDRLLVTGVEPASEFLDDLQ